MTNSKAADWRVLIPDEIVRRAFVSGRDLAWPQKDAMRVVSLLLSHGYFVTDVDVWLATSPGPTPTMIAWNERDPISAIEFIRTFAFTTRVPSVIGSEPYFNIWAE